MFFGRGITLLFQSRPGWGAPTRSHEIANRAILIMGVMPPTPPRAMSATAPKGTPPRRIRKSTRARTCPARAPGECTHWVTIRVTLTGDPDP